MKSTEKKLNTNLMHMQEGEKVSWNRQPYEVGSVNTGQVQLAHAETGVMAILSKQEIEREYSEGRLLFVDRVPQASVTETALNKAGLSFDLASEEDKAFARRLEKYMIAFRQECPDRLPNKKLMEIRNRVAAEIGDMNPLGRSQLRRILKQWEASGRDIRSLLPGTHRRGNRKSRLAQDLRCMIFDAIESVYKQKGELSVGAVHKRLSGDVREYNKNRLPAEYVSLPSDRTLRANIRKEMGYETVAARKGKKAMRAQFSPVYSGKEPERPLERVQVDTKTLDVFVNDKGTPKRGYLTLAIDEFSRCIVGYHISLNPPCAENALNCLFHAISTKS